MGSVVQLVTFLLDDRRYALRLDEVERVIRAVAVTPVPETSVFVLGLVDLAGQLLPVLSLRARFGMTDRPVRPEDQFIIVHALRCDLALVVDEVEGLRAIEDDRTVAMEDALPGEKSPVATVARIDGEILPICDLEQLFSREDQERIPQGKSAAGV